jgi:hypothetical protein
MFPQQPVWNFLVTGLLRYMWAVTDTKLLTAVKNRIEAGNFGSRYLVCGPLAAASVVVRLREITVSSRLRKKYKNRSREIKEIEEKSNEAQAGRLEGRRTRRHIPEGSILHSHRPENFKSDKGHINSNSTGMLQVSITTRTSKILWTRFLLAQTSAAYRGATLAKVSVVWLPLLQEADSK